MVTKKECITNVKKGTDAMFVGMLKQNKGCK